MRKNKTNAQATFGYNNCFVLGCKSRLKDGSYTKLPAYITDTNFPAKLSGGKDGKLRRYYEMTYEKAKQMLDKYMQGSNLPKGVETLRVSLYLDNAKFDDLHIFVMDFDKWDEESAFFKAAMELADKVTRSQGGGYHMFYGVNKETATPLFDSINLLASEDAKSYISKTGAISLDGKNKVDFFCDAYRFIYEWEVWDNTAGLTDKTQQLYELIRDNFSLKRPMEASAKRRTTRGGRVIAPERLSEKELTDKMTDKQRDVFCDLKETSSDCPREMWFSVGLDIYHAFGDELGRSVFFWWSEPGHSFNPQGCARTWENICERGPKSELRNQTWRQLLAVSAF